MDTCFVKYNDFIECRWDVWMWRTIPIFLILFGTFGNVINIIILSRKRLQKYPTTVYLIFLAVADLCTLWTAVFPDVLFNGFGQNLLTMSQFTCKSAEYVSFISGGYSVWLVVLLTVERMMLVRYPIFSRSKFTRRNALVTALTCFAVIAILFSYMPLRREITVVTEDSGNTTVQHIDCRKFDTQFQLVFTLLFFFLAPIALLLIANGLTITSVCLQRKKFCKVNTVGHVQQPNTDKSTKLTKMILFINAFFFFTTLPYLLAQVVESKMQPSDDTEQRVIRILTGSVLRFVTYCNFTFNFILYCVSGSIFHEEFQAFVKETKQKLSKVFVCQEVSIIHPPNNVSKSNTGTQL